MAERVEDSGRREGRGEQPMRILMIAPQPFFEPRGTPFSILNRLSSLTRGPVEVDLVTYPIGRDPGIFGVTIHRSARFPGIKSVPIGFSVRKIVLDALLILKARSLLRNNRYDLVHTHEEAGLVGNWMAGHYGVRHLYDMHSNLLEQMRKSVFFRHGPLRWLGEKLQKSALRNADAVITICPELQHYVDRVAPTVPHVLIENTFDHFAETAEGTRDEVEKLGLEPDESVLLYAGTLESYQGIELVIDAAPSVLARHPRTRFVLVGGTPGQVRYYSARADAAGVGERFSFTGMVEAHAIPGFIDAATVLLSPRRRGTNTPSKIYTYLRSGKPMVATALETHTQVLTDDVAVLTPLDGEAFAAGINAMLDDPARRDAIATRAQAYAAEKYDVALYHDALRELYASLGAVDESNGRGDASDA